MLVVTTLFVRGEPFDTEIFMWLDSGDASRNPTIGRRGFAPVTQRVLTPPLGGSL